MASTIIKAARAFAMLALCAMTAAIPFMLVYCFPYHAVDYLPVEIVVTMTKGGAVILETLATAAEYVTLQFSALYEILIVHGIAGTYEAYQKFVVLLNLPYTMFTQILSALELIVGYDNAKILLGLLCVSVMPSVINLVSIIIHLVSILLTVLAAGLRGIQVLVRVIRRLCS